MTDELIFANYSAFTRVRSQDATSESEDVGSTRELLERWTDRVQTRGIYSTSGFTAPAYVMFWWITRSPEDLQHLLREFHATPLGRTLRQTHAFTGLVRPAEFTRDHSPAFIDGWPAKTYACVYPFVRTPDWYLLESEIRAKLLREHGEAAREFPDVQANTTSGFGLGDYEWILCFEADRLDHLVDLIRRLRATEARRYTKLEVPFLTGMRKDLSDAVADLP